MAGEETRLAGWLPSRLCPIGTFRPSTLDHYLFRAAFLAEADRSAGLRFRATARACRESACFDASALPSRLSACRAACERFRDGFAFGALSPFSRSCIAFRRVSSGTLPFLGTGNFTPARLALERPMAIACLVDRAPCSPLRIASISSRTNSPACVEVDFPARLSRRARSMVCFFGMAISKSLRGRSAERAYERQLYARHSRDRVAAVSPRPTGSPRRWGLARNAGP